MKPTKKPSHDKNFGRGNWKAYFRLIPYIKLPWLLILIAFIVDIGYSEVLARVPVSTSALFGGNLTGAALASAIIYNLLSYVLMLGSICLISCVSAVAVRRAQGVLWKRMLRLDMAYYDANDPSNLLSTLTNDTETAVNSLISQLISVIPSLYYVIRVLITLQGYDFRLLVSMLVLIPLNVAYVVIVGRWKYEVNAGIFRQVGGLTGFLAERVSNLFLIRSFTNEEKERENGMEAAKGLYSAKVRAAKVTLVADTLANVLDVLQRCVPIVFGLYLLKMHNITMEQWVAFFLFVGQLIPQVNSLISTWSDIKSAQGAASRMIQIMDAPIETAEECKASTAVKDGDIVFHNINFAYGDKTVLNNINLNIPSGKATALVGRCGSGKTTLMSLIERLYVPTSGTITLDGTDISSFDRNAYRAHFAYVQQDAGLFGGTLRSAMTYGIKRDVSDEELLKAAEKTGAQQLVQDTPGGLDAHLAINGSSVSGGQRQRMVLTREVLKGRSCLLLDEPTSALDARSAFDIQQKLLEVFHGTTMLMITHDLRLLSAVDQIIFLENGTVVDSGTHLELMSRCAPYRDLVNCCTNSNLLEVVQ